MVEFDDSVPDSDVSESESVSSPVCMASGDSCLGTLIMMLSMFGGGGLNCLIDGRCCRCGGTLMMSILEAEGWGCR